MGRPCSGSAGWSSAVRCRRRLVGDFLSALRAYPDLPADANVQAWLVTIAHRKAIDIIRGRQRRGIGRTSPGTPSTASFPDGRSTTLGRGGALPDKQRQTVAYHYLAGMPYAISPRSSAAPRKPPGDLPPTASRRLRQTFLTPHETANPDEQPRTMFPEPSRGPGCLPSGTDPAALSLHRDSLVGASCRRLARHRLPDNRDTRRHIAARRNGNGTGPRGLRPEDHDPCSTRSREGEPTHPAGARSPGQPRRRLTSTSPAPERFRPPARFPAGDRLPRIVLPTSRDRLRDDRELRRCRRGHRQPAGGPRGRHRLRDEPAAGRRALPSGRAADGTAGGYVGGPAPSGHCWNWNRRADPAAPASDGRAVSQAHCHGDPDRPEPLVPPG